MRRTLHAVFAAAALLSTSTARADAVADYEKLKKAGKNVDALAGLEKASDAAPKDCKILKTLGNAYYDAKDADLGTMTLERFIRECPADPDLGAAKERVAKHFDTKASVDVPPDDAGVGGLYLVPLPPQRSSAGRTEEDAWAAGEDATQFDFKKVELEQGIEMMRLTRFKEAATLLETYIKKEPKLAAQGYRYLGTARAQLGEKDAAIKAYEAYLKLDPKAPDADPIRRSINFAKKK